MRQINRLDVSETNFDEFGDFILRTVKLSSGEVLFLASDIAINVLGVKNPFNLTKAVDVRNKAEIILTFVEEYNPQRYIFVNLEGLRCMVYRARNCEVNRFDFILWAQEKSVN
jgi:prophage antirepressor-like protein